MRRPRLDDITPTLLLVLGAAPERHVLIRITGARLDADFFPEDA